jgi:hypothetical protein
VRLVSLFLLLASVAAAAVPPALDAALKNFRADPPRGWSYTQTTAAQGESTVERYDATKPEFERWSLVQKNGRTPTAGETATYNEIRSRRSRGGTAPKLTDQIDTTSIEILADTPERATFRTRLAPGERGDVTAAFLRLTVVVHKPTATIAALELTSAGEFSPTFAVKIAEMKTAMTYSLPAGDTPSFPEKVTTRVRGRAFLFRSLDADMTVTYSDYAKAGKN